MKTALRPCDSHQSVPPIHPTPCRCVLVVLCLSLLPSLSKFLPSFQNNPPTFTFS
ncbi:uncharacterized protein LACBIDRAFT_316203 [Laccaria bicolor S238N-H82]|uniref:Predicted protein n=1 Tax=Laccaria bicolor (strain S238N-H82 / ATCC MYA-4686) TaxID=486041 RepID=B0E0F3_LACBS|nr:uncharacterized protein LACBIDRAFT_316203 [Laccaria bicolor S238N-H82]EDQ99708.1 predicted protein [Laccaria bicolor S238N-H82]|eukprot:XP_001889685.1 predicted protein [Laccaria bicolor S238N-H82]